MIPLYTFILVPLVACIIECFFIKLKAKQEGLIPLIASLTTTVLSIYIAFNTPSNFNLLWIHQWDIDINFYLNGISNIFIIICSVAFLIQTILSFNKQKSNAHWCMNLLLQATLFSFVLTQNLAFRIISWELCWVPIFIMLINTDKGHSAIKFSKIWFIAQTLLVCGTVIMIGKFNRIYEAAFWLMFIALLIRTYLGVSNRFKPETTILINVIMPLLPIIFFINTIIPNFYKYLTANAVIITIFICTICLVWIFKLIVSRSVSAIYAVNISVFSGLILAWLLKPDLQILQLCVQIILAKTILNILITYYGQNTHHLLSKWIFIISLLLSFGFSGVVIGTPMLKILSLWGVYQQVLAITMLALVFILFIVTVIKTSKLFNNQIPSSREENWQELTKLIAVSIIFIGVVVVSTDPSYLNNNVEKYNQSILTGEKE